MLRRWYIKVVLEGCPVISKVSHQCVIKLHLHLSHMVSQGVISLCEGAKLASEEGGVLKLYDGGVVAAEGVLNCDVPHEEDEIVGRSFPVEGTILYSG